MHPKIIDIYNSKFNKKPVFSFEFFPPKDLEGEKRLFNTVKELKNLEPDFISVTCGAGGSSSIRNKTLDWCKIIQNDYNINSMVHYTCIGVEKNNLDLYLKVLKNEKIINIMALRGDKPKVNINIENTNIKKIENINNGFLYANELIDYIKSKGDDFSIGAACYPEIHNEAISAENDLQNLARKVKSGTDFLITQLFFDNKSFFDFREKCNKLNINVPIIPGIMSITNFNQIERFTKMTGCKIPEKLKKDILECEGNQEKLNEVSFNFTLDQCKELLNYGVQGIHFFTLNQSNITKKIFEALK